MRVRPDHADRGDAEGSDVDAVQVRRRGRDTGLIARITGPGRGRGSRRRPAPSRRQRTGRIQPSRRTRPPEAPPRPFRQPCRPHERGGVSATVPPVEVRCRRPSSDQLDVYVHAGPHDVAKLAAVAVDAIQARVDHETHRAPDRHQPKQRGVGGARVALARSELRRVHLQEPDASSVSERERVAVVDRRDGRDVALPRIRVRRDAR
jgi:hypothetical protein